MKAILKGRELVERQAGKEHRAQNNENNSQATVYKRELICVNAVQAFYNK